jgi:uncharacterized repeat protein (TIGR02543 family)
LKEITLHVPAGSKEAYEAHDCWKQFTIVEDIFTVTFKDWDGTVLKTESLIAGTDATAPDEPSREFYHFVGWDKDFTGVTDNMEVTAQYQLFTWHVTLLAENGSVSVLPEETDLATVAHGTTLTLTATPDDGYEFVGWSDEVKGATRDFVVVSDTTLTASFALKKYTVRFLNWDGTVLQSSEWEYNTTPVYSGETPVRAEDEDYTYAFKGWQPEIAAATADADYTAQFTATEKDKTVYFTVTYYDWDLTILGTEQVEEGHDAQGVNPEPTRDGYIFAGWSKPLTNITSDPSVQAQYKENDPTGIDEAEASKLGGSTKLLRDGVLYIERNGQLYTVTGAEVK